MSLENAPKVTCPGCGGPEGRKANYDDITDTWQIVACATCRAQFSQRRYEEAMEDMNNILAKHNVPKMFQNARMSDFKISAGPRSFVHGQPGRGKTHLMVAVLAEQLALGKQGIFITERDLNESLKQFDEKNMDRYVRAPMLFLDDVGVMKLTDWSRENMEHLVDKRYASQRPLMITTNHSPASFARVYGERIASRVLSMAKIVEMTGEDRRQHG